ncbi:MAG TPA: alpha/beta fold hydrolase [Candidatus Dormibacteraeota bacterium]|nr:alpha/beta fold hydrolase [Candidatus Dormibacteraeota bacterium]
MPHTDTGMRARLPDQSGYAINHDGLRIYYEVFGAGDKTLVLVPNNPISHSRMWKAQIPYLARHFRVVAYDGIGNGMSDHPSAATRWTYSHMANECLAVMDATDTSAAVLVALCDGVAASMQLAVSNPDRVLGIFAIAPGVPFLTPPIPERAAALENYEKELDRYEGWAKDNRHYIESNFRGFMQFWFEEMFPEPHSTKQIEDTVAYALDGRVETFLMEETERVTENREESEALLRQVSCPVFVIQGDDDHCQPFARGERTAELTGARRVVLPGSGHIPNGRRPVKVNQLISEFAGDGKPSWPVVRRRKGKRALLISSPIGLGHAWRDVAIARELRRQVPGLEVEWLAQAPLTTLLEAVGEKVHPASHELAPESAHVDNEAREHELHAFQMIRRMDEILCANFMVFHDVVAQEKFDAWIADEGWEIDHFLHEEPQLKTSPYVWMSDFCGFVPMPSGGEREASLVADYNAEMIEHVDGHPGLRDLSIFIGDPVDVAPRDFGPGLPSVREWTESHFRFSGYVLPFDPATLRDRMALRRELGYHPDAPLIVASVGGSAVGIHLLRRIAAAFDLLRRDMPDAELLMVCGPRISPAEFSGLLGVRAVGYVHDLYRTLACCDLAVVQGGLSTTMELVANRRSFIYLPLRNHFEQNFHVAHRLQRYGAPPPTDYASATPARLAEQMLERLRARVDYAPVEAGGAARAAAFIAPLLGQT